MNPNEHHNSSFFVHFPALSVKLILRSLSTNFKKGQMAPFMNNTEMKNAFLKWAGRFLCTFPRKRMVYILYKYIFCIPVLGSAWKCSCGTTTVWHYQHFRAKQVIMRVSCNLCALNPQNIKKKQYQYSLCGNFLEKMTEILKNWVF